MTNSISDLCILYVRQSDARDDDEKGGIDYHVDILTKEAVSRNWAYKIVIENDVSDGKGGIKRKKSASAFKRTTTTESGRIVKRVRRPRFEEVLEDLWEGRANRLLAVELDRAMRDPRDLEDLIDVVQAKGLNVGSIGGTLQFTDGGTDDEIDRARFLVMMANRESRTRRNRTKRYRERDCHLAKGHGIRPFGWEADRKTANPHEKAVIVRCCDFVLLDSEEDRKRDRKEQQGKSLRQLAAMLRAGTLLPPDKDGNPVFVPTVTGVEWSAEGLRDLLVRHRNAGIVIHQKQRREDRVAEWEPLIDVDTFEAVLAKLTDTSRLTNNGGRERKHLGSGVFLCGKCADGTTMQVTKGQRDPRYRCCGSANHLTRNQHHVDTLVKGVMVELLTDGALARMLDTSTPDIDLAALRREKRAITEHLDKQAEFHSLGHISDRQFLAASKRGNERIAELSATIQGAITAASSELAAIATAEQPAQAWLAAPLIVQQAVMREMITVTILPTGRAGRGFDPDGVRIERKMVAVTEETAMPEAA
jgi:site-specific DNA recombinase